MIFTMKINKRTRGFIYTFVSVLFWIAVWYIAARRVGKSILLPSPGETMSVFLELVKTKSFWIVALSSLKSIFSGALIGVILGAVIATLSYISPLFKYLFSPILSLVKATPVASFIILALVWIGKDYVPLTISMMMATPIVAANLFEGLNNVDGSLKEVVRLYRLDFSKRWSMLYRHSLLPYFMSAIKSALALSWKAGIAAEVLCTPRNSIGLMLHESKIYFEFPTLFAWTLTVVLLSFILERIVVFATELIAGRVGEKV